MGRCVIPATTIKRLPRNGTGSTLYIYERVEERSFQQSWRGRRVQDSWRGHIGLLRTLVLKISRFNETAIPRPINMDGDKKERVDVVESNFTIN